MTAIKNPSHGTDRGFPAQVTAPSRRSRARRLARRNPVAFTVAVIIAVIMILPFVTLIISALTPASQMGADRWLPTSLRWANFVDATRYITFWAMTKSSVILSSMFAVLATFSSALTGYGFARLRGPGKNVLFVLLIGTMMVPPIVTLIPTYLLFSDYHLVGTYWPWVLWGAAGTPYAIFLYRQFFSSFPKELEEAAVIDGAGPLRIFIQVFLPLSRPLLVTAFVLGFNAVWGDFIGPDLFLNQSTAPPFETKLQFNAVPMYGLWYVTPDIDRIAAMVATAGGRITSVLADDQALIRAGFRVLIEVAGDIEVVGEAVNGEQAVDLARRERADVVLMDIRMPGVDGLEATRRIAADEDLAGVKVIILTTFESDEYVYQASGP